MKRVLIFTPILFCIWANAQKSLKVLVLNSTDSLPIIEANVELRYLNQKHKNQSIKTDSYGVALFNINQNGQFNILVSKDGYKTYYLNFYSKVDEIKILLSPLFFDAEEVTVTATRSGISNTATNTVITKKEIAQRDFGQDIPLILNTMPSTVSTSDAGCGVGYSGISIRGTDATRINVTINGVPLNDAESQGVFWVDLPDFSGSTENIQVQRGVGTSTNGAAAFGAGINIKTDKFSETQFSKISFSAGSFNTFKQSIKIGTGKTKNNWYTECRLSQIKSDGYIDRASSNLQSFSFNTGHKTDKSLFQILFFTGKEKTYQAWNGVPLTKFNENQAETDSLISFLWYDSLHAAQLRNSKSQTYNYCSYPNETDNYSQSHLQIIYNLKLNKNSFLNFVLHGTAGKGYYENFEYNTNLSKYVDTPIIYNGNKYYSSDLIRQRWLDNKLAGFVFSFNRNRAVNENILGGGFNIYKGKHFGEIIWHEFMNLKNGSFKYYNNNSTKTDGNIYWKMQHKFSSKLTFFTDVQIRHVYYSWYGPDTSGIQKQQNKTYFFFNPKTGLQYQIHKNSLFYITYGRASREPVRDDFINTSRKSLPYQEFLNNIEAGFKKNIKKTSYSITAFYMGYVNQLALSGKINDVGSYSRINIEKSYRCGLELETSTEIAIKIEWKFNLTLSQNKAKQFTEYIDDWTNGGQVKNDMKNTTLALSPSIIMGSQLIYKPLNKMYVIFNTKYVGRQYLDNTQTLSRSISPFLLNDFIIQYDFKIKTIKNINVGLMINNIGNTMYAASGYNFSGIINNSRKDFSFVFPQAGTNFLARVILDF
ncbi:MAG: TonB-dependent receptor [Bacteroidetes bacterium]|nr:TonB-dependent receptor [Bacteroidota bacterium]